jgi:hypothetical protein
LNLLFDVFRDVSRLFTRRAVLGVAIAVILEYFSTISGLEFAVGAFGNLGQVKILTG